jgi:uncharacterized protein (TIGR00156 family)
MFLSFAAAVHGQGFTGPGSPSGAMQGNQDNRPVMAGPVTAIEAGNLPHDSWVELTGNIINMLPGGKHFTFRDSSGEIAVEIGSKHWRGLSVDAADRVFIYGESKIKSGQVSVKAHAITGTGRVNVRQGQPVMVSQHIAIREIMALPKDSFVRFTGYITNGLPGGKNFVFRDSSGEITVEIGPKHWRGLSVGTSDRLEIYGEVKVSRGQVSIKAHAVKKIGA